MNLEDYWWRIDFRGNGEPNAGTLRRLHLAHLHMVPFENLDIPLGRPIRLGLPAIYEKIVTRRRGGFCYELNGLFGWLLKEMGFRVEMLSGRVFGGGEPGPEFDHMTLLVDIGEPLIVDVGFGDSFVEPLPLDDKERFQHGYWYRFLKQGGGWRLERRRADSDWVPQYVFNLKPHQLEEFAPMCHYQQTSSDSVFTKKSVCSKATPDGRITLSNGRLIVTTQGGREERKIESAEECRTLLKTHFGIEFDPEADVGRLLVSGSG